MAGRGSEWAMALSFQLSAFAASGLAAEFVQLCLFDVASVAIVKFGAGMPKRSSECREFVSYNPCHPTAPNPDSFLPAMSAIAREAGALLLHYFHQGLKIEYKGDADLVTAADRASETLIRERISNSFLRMTCWAKSKG